MPEPPVTSPCIQVCVIDEESGLCRGCLRSLDEIARWGALGDAARAEVMDALPARRARLAPPKRW